MALDQFPLALSGASNNNAYGNYYNDRKYGADGPKWKSVEHCGTVFEFSLQVFQMQEEEAINNTNTSITGRLLALWLCGLGVQHGWGSLVRVYRLPDSRCRLADF
jgi:hypothetical protein